MAWKEVRKYYPASRFAGSEEERRAQFRGPRGGLYDVKFAEVEEPPEVGATCPVCGGEGVFMGNLGRKSWFRCRDCGIEFNKEM